MPFPVSVKQQRGSPLLLHCERWPHTLGSSRPTSTRSPSLGSGNNRDSPFSRLPFEICVEIFSHCPADFPRIDSHVPPITLALVCKTWYYLVTTTPRLWSCFEIVVEGVGYSQSEKHDVTRRLQLWLRRSRQHPLSFRIIHNYTGTVPDLRSAELLTILLSHASRWQHVHFHGPSGGLAHLPDKLPKGSLPALRSLSVRLNKPWDSTFDTTLFRIPWSQLAGLDLQIYHDNTQSLNECFKILSAARNLTWCTLNATCPFALSEHPEKLALPSLKSFKLIIQGNDPTGIAARSLLDFLGCLSMTSLKALSLEWLVNPAQGGADSQWTAVHPRFTHFIHSSASSLENLGLAYLPLQDHEIISSLDGLSRLRTLQLKFSLASQQPDQVTEDVLTYLTMGQGGVEHLPLLSTLKLQCSGEYLNQAMLSALLDSRVTGQLKTFELMTMKLLSKDFRDRVAVWRNQGFDFSVSTLSIR